MIRLHLGSGADGIILGFLCSGGRGGAGRYKSCILAYLADMLEWKWSSSSFGCSGAV